MGLSNDFFGTVEQFVCFCAYFHHKKNTFFGKSRTLKMESIQLESFHMERVYNLQITPCIFTYQLLQVLSKAMGE